MINAVVEIKENMHINSTLSPVVMLQKNPADLIVKISRRNTILLNECFISKTDPGTYWRKKWWRYISIYCSIGIHNIIYVLPRETGLRSTCEERRPRSACAKVQADQGLRCSLTQFSDALLYVGWLGALSCFGCICKKLGMPLKYTCLTGPCLIIHATNSTILTAH